MNKIFGDGPHGKVLALVLEPGNIHKMVTERKPIELSLNDGPYRGGLPAKLSLVIMYSESPVADAQEFAKLLDPAVIDDRRTPVIESKRPHCPQCASTIEQLGVWRGDAPVWLVFCTACGCTLGVVPPVPGLERGKA